MKRAVLFLLLVLLTGCASAPAPTDAPRVTWTPPAPLSIDLSEEAQSALSALDLCREFVRDMNSLYPDYAPVLPDEDIEYYEKRLRDRNADAAALSSDLAGTILSLRQQVYLNMEETAKRHMPLPEGLEQFVREYEARFHEIGW